ncbi:zinc transporter ZupT [Trueperella pyogenes]|uniref:zinc transporter ZupT n=1 Tax=Trueperella pyogenes TaxID=1661 RepID=UPI00324EC78A
MPELIAFTMTLLAGLATGIGAAVAFLIRTPTPRILSLSLGFSAGVMLYVSFVEIMPTALEILERAHDAAAWLTVGSFFGGIALIAIIDWLVPEVSNPHEFHDHSDFLSSPGNQTLVVKKEGDSHAKLMRMGIMTALALAIHNFPEGIAVSVPIYYATGSRKKAFGLSFASGLSEPIGALLGYLILREVMNDTIFGLTSAAVAGIMVYISLDELLPSAEKFGKHHHAMFGLIAGMAVMALSLLLL